MSMSAFPDPPEGFELLDSSADPEQAAEAVQSVLGPEELEVPLPPDTQVKLQGGLVTPDGVRYDTAEVRELTGEDEEALSRLSRGNLAPVVMWLKTQQTMLERAVLKIGTSSPDTRILLDMLVGDRNSMLLGIRRATYGDDLEMYGLRCPKCTETFDVMIELNKDIKYRDMEDPTKRTFEIPLRGDKSVEVRLVTGQDQIEAVGDGRNTIAEQNTILLRRCIIKYNGKPLSIGNVASRMGMKDRRTIIDFLVAHQPGPILQEVSVPCSKCEQFSDLALDMADLFQV